MKIRTTTKEESKTVEQIHKAAFTKSEGADKGQGIATLAHDLLEDETAKPIYSLAAVEGEELVGHIIFTKLTIEGCPTEVNAQILGPVAVLPHWQSAGVGHKLIKAGLEKMKSDGVDIVFVLGHIDYYPRVGFINDAKALGFEAPHFIPDEFADAWMVQELTPGTIDRASGKVRCSNVLNQPEHWRE